MLPRRALPLDPRRLNRTSDINETVHWVISGDCRTGADP